MGNSRRWIFPAVVVAMLATLPAVPASASTSNPGGRLLVLDPTGLPDPYAALSSVRPSGRDQRDLHLQLFWFSHPDYSPDGRRIAFVGTECCYNVNTATATGTDVRWLVSGPTMPSFPRWSPDGQWISLETNGNIWRVNAAGYEHGWGPVTGWDTSGKLTSAWSPDSTRLAVTSWDASPNIWIYQADGSRSRQLTFQTGWNPYRMDWSPNGHTIVVEANGDLWTVNAHTGRTRQLTRTPDAVESSPVFSPDGRWLAYARAGSDPGAVPRVWLMRTNGSHRHPISITGTPTSWTAHSS